MFLKLLEAQLIKYHKGDQSFRFLNYTKIPQYDELYKLFFQVLAKRQADRSVAVNKKFENIPYLNSSLFEISELEDQTIKINSLDDAAELDLYNGTVLRDDKNKPVAKCLNSLKYLFDFLDAYDFASEGSEEIQEESKTLINASVLGLIFEKINGYKDGSIFTPGFITMYMCRQTIRLAVLQKIKEAYGWKCDEFEDLKNYMADRRTAKDILEFNKLINGMHLCDPAVGSGHFLVSSLNEIIAIKAELGILADDKGVRLSGFDIDIENDELIVTYNEGQDIFEYQVSNGSINKEVQRVQKTLFHEKQTVIENCLFGVDINPNSVKICRLRLWIELLKNAYYTEESKFKELETLPNIDINIKCGNSLVSRFALDADLSKALKSIKYNIDQYKGFVHDYKNAHDKDLKRGLEKIINAIKNDFRVEISKNSKEYNDLLKWKGELIKLTTQTGLFELSSKEKKDFDADVKKLTEKISKQEALIEDIKSNVIYRNAFEWRFEFPEVLDKDGNFEGFDVIVGNPPYVVILKSKQGSSVLDYFNKEYKTAEYNPNTYSLFTELAISKLLKPNAPLSFIIPNSWLNGQYFTKMRGLISSYENVELINLKDKAFDVIVETVIILTLNNLISKKPTLSEYVGDNVFQTIESELGWGENPFEKKSENFINRFFTSGKSIKDFCIVYRGVETKENAKWISDEKKDNNWKPILLGKDVHRFKFDYSGSYINFIPKELKSNANIEYYNRPKILMRRTGNSIIACADFEKMIALKNLYLIIPNDPKALSLILLQLNSKLFDYIHKTITTGENKAFAQFPAHYVEKLPCIVSEGYFSEADKLLKLIQSKESSSQNLETIEQKINDFIYRIYNLTEEEIKIVEGA